MKLTVLLLLGAFLQVSAKTNGQAVTLSMENVKLETVLKAIKKQTRYTFFADAALLRTGNKVTVQFRNAPLEQVLQACFKDQPFTYTIQGKIITLEPWPATAAPADLRIGRPVRETYTPLVIFTVTGRVLDASGAPIAGVSISVKGKKGKGTTSDNSGYFSIDAEEGDVLVASSVGHLGISVKVLLAEGGTITPTVVATERQEADNEEGKGAARQRSTSSVMMASGTLLTFTLLQKISTEDAVTVSTGYWTTTNLRNTGNISKVTSKDIERQPVTSLLLALQGRVPGLEITPMSAAPGAAPRIRIRGDNSLRGGNGIDMNGGFEGGNYPLYVVDGLVMDSRPLQSQSQLYFQGIDPLVAIGPENIESIEILKDAGATAIYGSQGANGVILITTKKGSRQNKTDLDVSVYKGAGKVARFVQLLNTQQHLEIRREAYANAGATPSVYDWDLTRWDTTRYTDWQKELMGGTANVTDVQVGFAGGSALTNFRLIGGFYKEGTIMPGDFGNTRIGGSFSFNHRTTNDRFNISFTASYGRSNNKLISTDMMFQKALYMSPNAPQMYTADGKLNWDTVDMGSYALSAFDNPLADLLKSHEYTSGTWMATGNVSYKLLPGLKVSSTFGYTETGTDELMQNPIAAAPYRRNIAGMTGTANFSYNRRNTWQIDPQLNYSQTIGKHHYEILTGLSFRNAYNSYQAINAYGYTSDLLLNTLKGAASLQYIADNEYKYRYMALFGRLHYNYNEQFLIDLTARRDGSSRFGSNNRFGNFGAIAGAWIFINEKPVAGDWCFLTLGKLRASYGITASDNIGDYKYYDLFVIYNQAYGNNLNLLPTGLSNPDYKWERNRKLEVALELGLINNKITLAASWYKHRADNQLIDYDLPATAGFPSILRNYEAVIQNMGWEFVASSKNISGKDFQWTTSLNVSIPRNKLIAFPGLETSPYADRYKVGEQLDMARRNIWERVDPATGQHVFKDIDNDGVIDYYKDRVFMRNYVSKYSGGLSNTLTYKSLSVSFLLQFTDRTNQNVIGSLTSFGMSMGNSPVEVMNRWQKPGDITDVARLTTDASAYESYGMLSNSNYGMVNADFIRLKTLSVSYSVPVSLIERIKLKECTLFIQGQNLFTVTAYTGVDPETAPRTLPPMRIFTGGVRVRL